MGSTDDQMITSNKADDRNHSHAVQMEAGFTLYDVQMYVHSPLYSVLWSAWTLFSVVNCFVCDVSMEKCGKVCSSTQSEHELSVCNCAQLLEGRKIENKFTGAGIGAKF